MAADQQGVGSRATPGPESAPSRARGHAQPTRAKAASGAQSSSRATTGTGAQAASGAQSSSRAKAGSGTSAGGSLDRASRRASGPGHSTVEALLAEHIGAPAVPDAGTPPETVQRTTAPQGITAPRAPEAARAAWGVLRPAPLPPMQDVAIGLATLLAEYAWRTANHGARVVSSAAAQAAGVVRAVAPSFATAEADARLGALAERGRRVRLERTEAVSVALSGAITSAATSDAVREMTVTAIEQATDDVLAVVLPAMLEAVQDLETQEKLDELMAGLLLRQLPSALEKTLPGVMLRTATKPAMGLMPSLMNALNSGLTGDNRPS